MGLDAFGNNLGRKLKKAAALLAVTSPLVSKAPAHAQDRISEPWFSVDTTTRKETPFHFKTDLSQEWLDERRGEYITELQEEGAAYAEEHITGDPFKDPPESDHESQDRFINILEQNVRAQQKLDKRFQWFSPSSEVIAGSFAAGARDWEKLIAAMEHDEYALYIDASSHPGTMYLIHKEGDTSISIVFGAPVVVGAAGARDNPRPGESATETGLRYVKAVRRGVLGQDLSWKQKFVQGNEHFFRLTDAEKPDVVLPSGEGANHVWVAPPGAGNVGGPLALNLSDRSNPKEFPHGLGQWIHFGRYGAGSHGCIRVLDAAALVYLSENIFSDGEIELKVMVHGGRNGAEDWWGVAKGENDDPESPGNLMTRHLKDGF